MIGLYWDLVAMDPARPSGLPLVVNGLARYCVRFTPDSVYHYFNVTAACTLLLASSRKSKGS